jgi:zinc protease
MKSFSIMLLLLSAALCANVMMADNVNQKSLMSNLPKKGKIVKESFNEALGVKDLELSNGVRVLLKHTDYEPDNILMHATQRGGSSLYGEKDWANYEKFNDVIRASGLGGLSNMELKQVLTDKNIEMGFSMDTYEDDLWGTSTVKDLETLFQLAYLQFTDVTKDEKSYNTLIKAMEDGLKEDEQAPDNLFFQEDVFMDSIMSVMSDHNWRDKRFKSADVARLNYDRILEIARERTANAAGYTFVFIGSFDEAAIRPLIEQYIASLPANKAVKSNWVNVATYPQRETICHFTHKMEDPRAEINIRWINTQIPYSFENEIKANILSDILKFKRYRERIRLDNAGVYHEVGGNHQHYMQGDLPFTEVHTFVTLKSEFVDEAVHIIKEEMTKACEHIDEADFEEFKQGKLKFFANRKSDDNFYWLKTIEHYASTGEVDLGNDDVQIIQALTPEDISAFARKLLTTGNMVEIVMTPAE